MDAPLAIGRDIVMGGRHILACHLLSLQILFQESLTSPLKSHSFNCKVVHYPFRFMFRFMKSLEAVLPAFSGSDFKEIEKSLKIT